MSNDKSDAYYVQKSCEKQSDTCVKEWGGKHMHSKVLPLCDKPT